MLSNDNVSRVEQFPSLVADNFIYIGEEANHPNVNNYRKIIIMKGPSSSKNLSRSSLGKLNSCCIQLSLVFI